MRFFHKTVHVVVDVHDNEQMMYKYVNAHCTMHWIGAKFIEFVTNLAKPHLINMIILDYFIVAPVCFTLLVMMQLFSNEDWM